MMIGTLMPALCPTQPALADREAEPVSLACDPAAFLALMNGCLAAAPVRSVTSEQQVAHAGAVPAVVEAPPSADVKVAMLHPMRTAPPALLPMTDAQPQRLPQVTDLPAEREPLPAPVPPSTARVEGDLALPQQAHQAEPLPPRFPANMPVMPRIEAGPAGRAEPSTPRPATVPMGAAQLPSHEPLPAPPIERTPPVAAPVRAAAEVAPPGDGREITAPERASQRELPAPPAPLQSAQPAAPAVEPVAPSSPLPQSPTGEPDAALQPEQVPAPRQNVQAPRVDPAPAGEPQTPERVLATPPVAQVVADAVRQPLRPTGVAPLPAAAQAAEPGPPVLPEAPALEPEAPQADETALPLRESQPNDPPRELGADEPALERAETLPRGVPGPEVSPAPQHTENGRPPFTHDAGHAAVTIRGPLRLHASEQRIDAPERLVVEVDPPELGRCELELSLHEGRVRAVLVAERPETVEALRSVEGQVREQLAARELQVATFDVRHGPGQEQRQGARGGQDRQENLLRRPAAAALMRLQGDAPISRAPTGTGLVDVVA